MKRRNEKMLINLILNIAKKSNGIKAVIMNGSRANPKAEKDSFQDYDIVYVVDNVEPYVENQQWLKQFGELLLMQTPDEMDGIWPKSKYIFTFLMLFEDGNRIDLRLIRYDQFVDMPRDSQSILLLDKDQKLGEFESSSDKDYLPKQPTKKEFSDCCNEFLWVSTNVAKGICRKQLTYAKFMSEQIVKEQLIKLLIWYAGIKTNFQNNIGGHAKFLEQYLEPDIWNQLQKTYVDADYNNMWDGLFIMLDIFQAVALKISHHCGYIYDIEEFEKIIQYLQGVRVKDKNQNKT